MENKNSFWCLHPGEFFSDENGIFVKTISIPDPNEKNEPINAIMIKSNDLATNEIGSAWWFDDFDIITTIDQPFEVKEKEKISDLGNQRNFLASMSIPFFTRFSEDKTSVWIKMPEDNRYSVFWYLNDGKFHSISIEIE